MLPTPTSSPIFASRTNTLHTLPLKQPTHLPTPPSDNKLKKRSLLHDTSKPQKRLKLDLDTKNQDDDESDEDEDVFMESHEIALLRARQNTRSCNTFSKFRTIPSMNFRKLARMFRLFSHFWLLIWYCLASTLPILKSFVSSNKSDLFKCHSVGEDTYLTPPYACAFSHSALSYPFITSTTCDIMTQVLRTVGSPPWLSQLNKEQCISSIPPNEMTGT